MDEIIEQKEGRSKFSSKYYFFIGFGVVVFGFLIYFLFFNGVNENLCGDGTAYNQCSINSPYFCSEGILVEKASECGCPDVLELSGEKCVSAYSEGNKTLSLSYIVNGERGDLEFVVYEEMYNYMGLLPNSITYSNGDVPSRVDFKLRNINNEEQRELLMPLVVGIQNSNKNKVEQARIAISLVQNIEYGFSNRTSELVPGYGVNYSRYPYEILYEEQGICGEKSELLAFLLKELGYKTAILYYAEENHEAVGIGCPVSKSVEESGYCFIETTGPSILSDDGIEYVGEISLDSMPNIMKISNGISFPFGLYEYGDAKSLNNIRNGKFVLFKDKSMARLIEKYGLVDEYNLE